jgi:hypothetical protein
VATRILLAENANIGGWVIKNERLESQSGGAYLDGRNGTIIVIGKITISAGGNRVVLGPDGSDGASVSLIASDDKVAGLFGFTIDDSGIRQPFLRLVNGARAGDYMEITPYGMYFPISNIQFGGLPTSAFGLSQGSIWRDGNTLKIV